MLSTLKKIWSNPYVRFGVVGLIYFLWFVLWAKNLWWILGLVVIYDVYVSKKMYKLFGKRYKQRKGESKTYKKTAEWVEAIVFATVVASVIRIFFFEMYVIPSSSMEKTLLVGDYLCVSKVAYGPKMPNTPVAFPFVHHTMPFSLTKKSFSEIISRPYKRLSGFRDLERNDIVVFNYPEGDTVLLEQQGLSYYDMLNYYSSKLGKEYAPHRLREDYTVVSRPVDKRENYIKRAIGLPGDSIEIKDAVVYINGERGTEPENMQLSYVVYPKGVLTKDFFEKMNLRIEEVEYYNVTNGYKMALTKAEVEQIRAMSNIDSVRLELASKPREEIFPRNGKWNEDNFGPLWIPKKGTTIELNMDNLPYYKRVISVYEGHELKVKGGEIFIDGKLADTYTFEMDYYFMMGDNRHNSADSRYWGFVPEDHVVGTPSFVWLSLDKDKKFPANIRWSKIFRNINN